MKVGLFIPCYVDALYPEVGVSTYKLLRSLGVDVDYPEKQTCCGQPMGNAGFEGKAKRLVMSFDELFRGYDYVVSPSASCTAYVRFFHPGIAHHECEAAGKTVDLVEFLHDVLKVQSLPGKFPTRLACTTVATELGNWGFLLQQNAIFRSSIKYVIFWIWWKALLL